MWLGAIGETLASHLGTMRRPDGEDRHASTRANQLLVTLRRGDD